MSRGVDQVQRVLVPVIGAVAQTNGLRLDRDPTLSLQVHRVEHLLAHLPLGDGTGSLEQTVGKRRLTVVDVGDDAEVADTRLVGHCAPGGSRRVGWNRTGLYPLGGQCYLSRSLRASRRRPAHRPVDPGFRRQFSGVHEHGQHQVPDQAQSPEREGADA